MNKIYHINFLRNLLPDKCADLILADPPYYEVKGDFDFIWEDFDAYLDDVQKWVRECHRILKDNGTIFWYGSAKKIAYSQVIMDQVFTLINNLVWNKGSFMGLENSEGIKSFAPCTERILMYGSQAMDKTGLKTVEKEYVAPRNPFALELKKARIKKGLSIQEVAEMGKFYVNVNHGGSVTNWEKGYNIPNDQQWEILVSNLPIERTSFQELKDEYDSIRLEYESMKRTFNNIFNLQEVLNFSNEAVKTGSKFDHDTPKPETLTRALILTCSNPGDLVVVPFSGSGTECAMSVEEGRITVGYDILEKNVINGNKRVQKHLNAPKLL